MIDNQKLNKVLQEQLDSINKKDTNVTPPNHKDIPKYLVEAAYGAIMTVVKNYVESHPNPPNIFNDDEEEYEFYSDCKYFLEEASKNPDSVDKAYAISKMMSSIQGLLW